MSYNMATLSKASDDLTTKWLTETNKESTALQLLSHSCVQYCFLAVPGKIEISIPRAPRQVEVPCTLLTWPFALQGSDHLSRHAC